MTNDRPMFGIATALTKNTLSPAILGPWLETHGFESIWFGEHSHIPVELKSQRKNYKEVPEAFKELYDPLMALMGIAAVTKTLKLGTSVLILPEHHPIRLAKMISTLDQVSGGRVTIGVGGGWSAEEMGDYGVEFKDRWKVVRETVLAMRQIWGNEIAEFHGELINFLPMWSGPKPINGARLPIVIGAASTFAFPRIAEFGNGWVPVDQGDAMAGLMNDLRAYMETTDRSFDELSHSIITHPLTAVYNGDGDALKRRIDELYAIGFRRMLLTLPSETPDLQWKTLEGLHKIVEAYA
ncbi:TIGR03619 family F420-dependent LLM class oxidoreductase [Rhizorhabdus argentea]|uniref:TIGR03619 family F420-dependent LLM class oxidoreductase n=1 Tax=Rhizorhabdus argentea TaxID=1387174 RepID=UPI0030EF0E18